MQAAEQEGEELEEAQAAQQKSVSVTAWPAILSCATACALLKLPDWA